MAKDKKPNLFSKSVQEELKSGKPLRHAIQNALAAHGEKPKDKKKKKK